MLSQEPCAALTPFRTVDDDGNDVKPGSPGEILLKGPIIFNGYHNRPEETAKAFRDGWFCTGDIGEMRGDLLYIVDRKKVRGPFRPHKLLQPPELPLFASLYLMTYA